VNAPSAYNYLLFTNVQRFSKLPVLFLPYLSILD